MLQGLKFFHRASFIFLGIHVLSRQLLHDRLILQTQDVLKNGFFGESPYLCIQNASPLASITISQVAAEMGTRLTLGQAVAVGRKVSVAYKNKYGKRPSQHNQFVDAAVRSVNSYTLQDRDMVVTAIQSVADS